ncbi:unnamed protein product [Bracoviriform congregatae]|nr:unnamed protein product [Bracoviriform congregatae]CAG17486.1 unnamed protein product [Bracoviriform congregatae]
MKLDDAAQSSGTIVTDANAEPGSSRQEQSIIAQDNQTMESAQTGTTASDSNGTLSSSQRKDENLQESLPIQEQQELSRSYINVATPDTPTFVIDDNEEVQPTSIEEQQVPSYQAISQFTKQSKPVQQPRIVAAPSIEMTQKPVEKRIRLMNIKRNLEIAAQNQSNLMDRSRTLLTRSVEEQSSATTQNQSQDGTQLQEMRSGNSRKSTALLRSMAISSQEINDVPRINLNNTQNVNTVDPRNIVQSFTKVASASQSSLSSSLQRPSYGRQLDGQQSLLNQQQSLTQSYQNQCIPTNGNNFEQDLLRKSAERNNYEQRPNSRPIRMSTPSIGQNSIIPSSPLYQTSKLPQQRQSHPSQQDSQRQPQKPKIRIGTSTKPQNNRQTPTFQVTKETLSPILTKVLNSVRQALSTTHNQYLQNERQFQGNHSKRAPVNENHLSQIDNTLQTDEWMEEETPSAHYGANSDSDTVTDHEVTSDQEMSADEAPVERTNNFYGPGISSGSSSADRPIAAQNSTIHQTHSKVILEQQMLDNFATLLTQMGSTLRYTTDMYNTLRSSILDTAQTYKKLLGAVEEFNSVQKLASNSSSSSNRTEEVSQLSEERHIEVAASTSSSTQNQHSRGDANRTPKIKYNSWRLVLPPEYDPRDTRWTLKYRTNLPGLVELTPQSGVYVSYGDLKYCQQVSKDCQSLAKRLLSAVFNRKALSVCFSMTEKAQAPDNVVSNIRPELDDNACTVLLNFVLEHGLQRGWNTDLQPILSTLHCKIQEIRFKYGVVVQC